MKKKYYMVVDTETSTLPCAEWLCKSDEERKKIAIAKPLTYDFGYTVVERNGNIIKKVNHLVYETFCNREIFDLGYYANKRGIYEAMLLRGELDILPWDTIMQEFLTDLETVDAVGAFNSAFDFKKAIPFTELYIRKLYAGNEKFNAWSAKQETVCSKIMNNPYKRDENKAKDDGTVFKFRGKEYPLFDLWGLACTYLLDNRKYKDFCLENGLVTTTGMNFKTSAETTFKYYSGKYDFEESHTALDDAVIESAILGEITKRHKIENGITAFPFRTLGTTVDYVTEKKNPSKAALENIIYAMKEYLGDVEEENCTRYQKQILNKMVELELMLLR